MNRAQRRKFNLPRDETKNISILVQDKAVILRVVNNISGIGIEAAVDSRRAFQMSWALFKAAIKAWRTK